MMIRTVLLLTVIAWLVHPAAGGENWPQFLGPSGDGLSDAVGLPLTWSKTKNVAWKVTIHDHGWSSPVIWGDQIWLTTATEDGKQLFAVGVDRDSGRILHDVKVFDVAESQRIAKVRIGSLS
jgi:hypothetical protein